MLNRKTLRGLRKVGLLAWLVTMLMMSQGTFAQSTSLPADKNDSTPAFAGVNSDKKFEDSIKRELEEILAPKKSYFEAGLNYLSNNVYLGRKDTVITPYLNASLGYYHKSGFSLQATASYLPNASPGRFDLFTIEGGYSFKLGKMEGQLLADKYFFNSLSNNVKADVKETFAFSVNYDFGFIKPVLTPSLVFSDKVDFMLLMGIEHSFYFDEDAFDLTPTISANGSTQNYYSSYYRNRKYKVKKKKVVVATEKETIYGFVENASQFKVLDYEFILPINYTLHKFTFNCTPSYAVPVNAALVNITTTIGSNPPKTRIAKEYISNSFFWEMGLTYKF